MISQSLGPTLSRMAKKAVLRTAQDIFALDKAFFLIEGHPGVDRPGARAGLHPHGAAAGHQRRRQQASPGLPAGGLGCVSAAMISASHEKNLLSGTHNTRPRNLPGRSGPFCMLVVLVQCGIAHLHV